jgi:hypothetical protein
VLLPPIASMKLLVRFGIFSLAVVPGSRPGEGIRVVATMIQPFRSRIRVLLSERVLLGSRNSAMPSE